MCDWEEQNIWRLITTVFWSVSPTCQCLKEGVACQNGEKCEFTSRNTALRSVTNDYDLSPLSDLTRDIADSFSYDQAYARHCSLVLIRPGTAIIECAEVLFLTDVAWLLRWFRWIIQLFPARDYATLSRDYGFLSRDYAEYSMLSAHNPVNSTAITWELLLRRFGYLSMVETKKPVDEIMTVIMENTSTEDIPGHFVTNIIIFLANSRTLWKTTLRKSVPVLFTVATSVGSISADLSCQVIEPTTSVKM